MSDGYEYLATITRAGTGPVVEDEETGRPTLPERVTVVEDAPGDWQDGVESRAVLPSGSVALDFQAEWYFEDEALVDLVNPGDAFLVVREDDDTWSKQGEVAGVRILDGVVELRVR